jgi:hypothetical protein
MMHFGRVRAVGGADVRRAGRNGSGRRWTPHVSTKGEELRGGDSQPRYLCAYAPMRLCAPTMEAAQTRCGE